MILILLPCPQGDGHIDVSNLDMSSTIGADEAPSRQVLCTILDTAITMSVGLRRMGSCPDGTSCRWVDCAPEGPAKFYGIVVSPAKTERCRHCRTVRTRYTVGIIRSHYDGRLRWKVVYQYRYADGYVQCLESHTRMLAGRSADYFVNRGLCKCFDSPSIPCPH